MINEKVASIILVIFLSNESLNEVKMTDDTTIILIKQIADLFNIKGNPFINDLFVSNVPGCSIRKTTFR